MRLFAAWFTGAVSRAQHRHFERPIAVFFIEGSVLGLVMPQVRKDLSLSNTEYSLVTTPFLILYMIFSIVGGQLADKLGSRRTFSLNIIFWSLASMAHTVIRGIVSLCVFRTLPGVGED